MMPRKPILTPEQRAEIVARYRTGEWTYERLADWYWCSIWTIRRVLDEDWRLK